MTALLLACERSVAWRADDGGPPEAYRVPSAPERAALTARRAQLAVMSRGAGYSDADKRKAAAAIADMLGGFLRGRNLDERAKQAMIADFTTDLQSLPSWAITRACERVRKGLVEGISLDWVPTSPRMFQIVLAELGQLRAEQKRIDEVLSLRLRSTGPVSDEERKRLAEKAEAWLARKDPRARQLVGVDDDAERARAEARLERSIAESTGRIESEWQGAEPPTIAGMPISRELAQQLGYGARRQDIDDVREG